MNIRIQKLTLLILLSTIFMSCTEDVDFNQVDDFELNPVVESSLIHFDESVTGFFDDSVDDYIDFGEEIPIEDFIIVDYFRNGFIVDNLVKVELVFETQNTIHRDFELQMVFNDANEVPQHTFTIVEDASLTGSDDTLSTHIETFEGATLDAFKRSVALRFILTMLPGVPLNPDSEDRISLKSKAVLYFNINNR